MGICWRVACISERVNEALLVEVKQIVRLDSEMYKVFASIWSSGFIGMTFWVGHLMIGHVLGSLASVGGWAGY